MADEPTKNPSFEKEADIKAENARRLKSIEYFKTLSAEQIRSQLQCTLEGSIGRALIPPKGTKLHLLNRWLISPSDRKQHDALSWEQTLNSIGQMQGDMPRMPSSYELQRMAEIHKEQQEIYVRGSDYVRSSVGKAAAWACIPAELLAAVLQNENGVGASDFRRGLQAIERDLTDTGLYKFFKGDGSTGLGNVKAATLSEAIEKFKKYYKLSVQDAGVKDADRNDNADTDIYHAAMVLRDGLNKAWSGGDRSLNQQLSTRYEYYPFFGGTVSKDVATRAMGHYNGMGAKALSYGQTGMDKIQNKGPLVFMPPK